MGDTEPGAVAPSTRLIVGLGNPGAEYAGTRHNGGFRVLEEMARGRRGVRLRGNECSPLVGALGEDLLLALPQTFMNRSGHAVRCLLERRELHPGSILIGLDDVALPLGRLRLRPPGTPGGQRGLESTLESLQTDAVPRLRLGVREEEDQIAGEELADYVLGPFSPTAREKVGEMMARRADARGSR